MHALLVRRHDAIAGCLENRGVSEGDRLTVKK
jgi:hypothetical protein